MMDGMILYRGVIEDNNDLEKIGRVKVRIHGIHPEDKTLVKTEDLPWAEVMGGTSFGLVSGVGISSILRNGTWVWLMLEMNDPNKPVIMGTMLGINSEPVDTSTGFNDPNGEYPIESRSTESDINRLARVEKLTDQYYDEADARGYNTTVHDKINQDQDVQSGITDGTTGADVSQTEPLSTNDASEYPNVNVLETHSGHVIELDDTAGNERIRVYHRTGSYIEIKPDGSFVQKSVGSDPNHFITTNDLNIHIERGVKQYIEENWEEIINGNLLSNVKGNLKLHVEGNLDWVIGGNINITTGGTHTVNNGGNHSVTAPRIDLN